MQMRKLFLLWLACSAAAVSRSQPLKLDTILDSIRLHHPALMMYDREIRSMEEAAKGARSWMPPEFSTGLWMAPYNPVLWRKDAMGSPGMGQYMISGQQMIANKKKLAADAAYMNAMSAVEKEKKNATINDLVYDARQDYYEWLILKKKLSILEENEDILDFMIKNAELRYKNGLEKISSYYKAKAALGNVKNMQLMAENEIKAKKIALNTMMQRTANLEFEIDTSYEWQDFSGLVFDSSLFYANRSDLKSVDREIALTYLKQETEQQSLKPQFGIRYDHMFGFGGLPMQYSLMGMVKWPLAKWSSRMNRANIESLKWKAEALQAQKIMMSNEYSGMAYTMRNELELKKKQLQLYEEKIIPALKNNYTSMQLGYEQNTEELFMLYDAWETLNMTQLEYADLLGQALQMQVSLERLIEKK